METSVRRQRRSFVLVFLEQFISISVQSISAKKSKQSFHLCHNLMFIVSSSDPRILKENEKNLKTTIKHFKSVDADASAPKVRAQN